MCSFLTDITIVQPIKVVLLAVLISFLIKKPEVDDEQELLENEEEYNLKADEEWLHDTKSFPKPLRAPIRPPDQANVEKIRAEQLKAVRMHSIMREIIMYFIYLMVLMTICYSSQDKYNFLMKDHLTNELVTGNRLYPFDKVTSISQFWRWMFTGFVPAVYPLQYYNGDQVNFLEDRMLYGDHTTYILGQAIIRQLRVTPGSCDVHNDMVNITSECNVAYSVLDEDQGTYTVGWKPVNVSTLSPDQIRPEYLYTDADNVDSYPFIGRHEIYRGGGYMKKLKSTYRHVMKQVLQLYEEAWIDRYTRAVFLELSLYNPQVNLFAAVTILIEFLPAGGGHPVTRIDVIRFLTYTEWINIVRIACEVIFVIFLLHFLIKELKTWYREKRAYWKEFWNWAEWGIILSSVATIMVYFYRMYAINGALATLKKSHGDEYINLQYVAYVNEVYSCLLGWVAFIATIKFLKLFRFNRRVGLLTETLRFAMNDIFQFGIMFIIAFLGFTNVFYLVFSGAVYNYATYLTTLETLLTTMLNKFDFQEILVAAPILGPILFFIFMNFMAFVLINIFVSILNKSFEYVKFDTNKQQNDYEVVDFLASRMKMILGMHKPEDKKQKKVINPKDAVEDLPEMVDKFVQYVSWVYCNENNKTMNILDELHSNAAIDRKKKHVFL